MIFVYGLVGMMILIGIAVWLSWKPQSWYVPPDATQPAVATLADRAENRLNEEFHKVREIDEIWKIRVGDAAMNAWLVGRLEAWLTHDQDFALPDEVHEPQVHVTEDGIWIAAMIEIEESSPRPLAVQLGIRIEHGQITAAPIAVRLGRIPIPLSLFTSAVGSMNAGTSSFDAIVPLMDDREVEILDIKCEDGSLLLTCQTHLP